MKKNMKVTQEVNNNKQSITENKREDFMWKFFRKETTEAHDANLLNQ